MSRVRRTLVADRESAVVRDRSREAHNAVLSANNSLVSKLALGKYKNTVTGKVCTVVATGVKVRNHRGTWDSSGVLYTYDTGLLYRVAPIMYFVEILKDGQKRFERVE